MITTTSSPARLKLPEMLRHSALSEEVQSYYRTLLRNLPWPGEEGGEPLRTLALTSCQRGTGTSTVALHLAVAAAQRGAGRVLLVDGHLDWPTLFRRLGVQAGPGLAELILDDLSAADVVQAGPAPNLSVITAGGRCDAAAVYESPFLASTIETLKTSYDLVIFDLPPTIDSKGGLRLASMLDGVLLVLEAERVRWQVAEHAAQTLLRTQCRLLGSVLNKSRRHIPGWLYRRL